MTYELRAAALTSVLFSTIAIASGCRADAASEPVAERSERTVAVHVREAVATKRPIAIELDGTLLADEESNVTSIVAGRVTSVLVERGTRVEAGAELVRLRDVDFRLQAKVAKSQLDQARARLGMEAESAVPKLSDLPEVAVAEAELELANKDLARTEVLAAEKVVADQQLEQARTRARAAADRHRSALNSARTSISALKGAQAALEQANRATADAVVRAPFAGEIAERSVSPGEFVGPQTSLVTLVRTDPLRIELSVPQQHLADVQPGQTVTLAVDALPERSFTATVRYVSAAVQRDTRSLIVEAVVPNPDAVLRPGLFVAARLLSGGERIVTEVPSAAVHTAAGVSRVFVVAEGKAREQVVSVDERTGDTVVISEGLQPGDRVAIDGLDQLGDGVAVTVLDDAG